MDVTTILVSNLSEALRQVTNYLTLGLATAVSALVLDQRAHANEEAPPLSLAGISIAMTPDTAKMLLLGLCWVTGALAAYAVEGASGIVEKLRSTPEVLAAACTYPSIATAPIGVRVIGAVLPLAFVLPVMWRMWSLLRKAYPAENPMALLFIFFVPYGPLTLGLARFHCRV